MKKLTIIFLLLAKLATAQDSLDYRLYSMVLDDYVDRWDKDRDTIRRAIIIKKYSPPENYAGSYGREFLKSDDRMIDMLVHYDSTRMNLVRNAEVRDAFLRLESEFYQTPNLDPARFIARTPVTSMTSTEFHVLFEKTTVRGFRKWWKRFYKKNPDVFGIYEFSKTIYTGDFAILYVGHHAGPLFASGDIFVLHRDNGKWSILTIMDIWKS